MRGAALACFKIWRRAIFQEFVLESKTMRVIAVQTFHPPGLARPIMAGEIVEAGDDLADVWIRQGLARTLGPEEKAIKTPAEQATRTPGEKAIRKPRAKR